MSNQEDQNQRESTCLNIFAELPSIFVIVLLYIICWAEIEYPELALVIVCFAGLIGFILWLILIACGWTDKQP